MMMMMMMVMMVMLVIVTFVNVFTNVDDDLDYEQTTLNDESDVDDDITFYCGAREVGGRLTVAIFTVTPDSLYPPCNQLFSVVQF